ncbi:MAG: Betaine-aldehyde dehydrogenase [Naasia sp.]|jgi:acyl-CoA reductase-like NAD-dependent aldehyde dehydrogenase|uniref:aldehyde dehydrogenase family protein n=1 Tax=Naasia sp. TaxID=2546198 RepID=UPI002605F1E2|nr:aldehyde dehydrogenase family protein [Naasia sp.]MCU1571456.1 Betaine-aldehyde dehydrogenase [Naasia sp.]
MVVKPMFRLRPKATGMSSLLNSDATTRPSAAADVALREVSDRLFVRGELVAADGTRRTPVADPATGHPLGSFTDPTGEQGEQTVAAANDAQRLWNARTPLVRAELLHQVATRMRGDSRLIAELMTLETGKPFKESADEIGWAASALDYYAELGRHSIGTIHGTATPGQTQFTIKEAMGTVVIILPANFPILLMMWSAAAALAAGNAVIVKPSENAALTSLAFMRAFGELDAGLVQCLPGGADVAKQLVGHPETHMVAFTGSVPTGQAVARTCASNFKPFLIEASGSDAFIVMPSAAIEVAARAATFAAFLNCGQVCTAAEKILVHEDVYDEFMAAFVRNTRQLRIGHGLDRVDIGPMENARERQRIEKLLARAVEQGAKIVTGGARPDLAGELSDGYFFMPTVIDNCTTEMDLYTQELFGPIAAVYKVSSFDEALQITNASPFGLGATLYSTDMLEVDRAQREIVTGMVWVNAPLLDNDAGPFGGRKLSGIGRQLGAEGLDTFRHTKLVMVDPASSEQSFWWFPYADDEAW